MSEHETAQPAAAPAAATAKAGKSGSTLARVSVLAFILAVIGAECLIACLYLPTLSTPAAEAGHAAPTADDHHKPADRTADEHAAPESKRREVDLGGYQITVVQPATNTSLQIDFHLYGTVADTDIGHSAGPAAEGGHGSQGATAAEAKPADEFTRRFEKHKHRIRDQVITIVRSADLTDFADPSLGLIRRKILEKSNRTLGKAYLQEVIFSDFSIIEQ